MRVDESMKHRLLQIAVSCDEPDGDKYRGTIVSSWLGTFVKNRVILQVFKDQSNLIENAFLNRSLQSLNNLGEQSLEILQLCHFAKNPGYYTAVPIQRGSTKQRPPALSTKHLEPLLEDSSIFEKVHFLTNDEFDEFAVDISRSGLSIPLNAFYPGLGGIGHFRYRNGERETVLTLIIKAKRSAKHATGVEAMSNLSALVLRMQRVELPPNVDHRVCFCWLVDAKPTGRSSANSHIPLDQYYLFHDHREG